MRFPILSCPTFVGGGSSDYSLVIPGGGVPSIQHKRGTGQQDTSISFWIYPLACLNDAEESEGILVQQGTPPPSAGGKEKKNKKNKKKKKKKKGDASGSSYFSFSINQRDRRVQCAFVCPFSSKKVHRMKCKHAITGGKWNHVLFVHTFPEEGGCDARLFVDGLHSHRILQSCGKDKRNKGSILGSLEPFQVGHCSLVPSLLSALVIEAAPTPATMENLTQTILECIEAKPLYPCDSAEPRPSIACFWDSLAHFYQDLWRGRDSHALQTIPLRKRSINKEPGARRFQLMVCHDMAGGYHHDKHIFALRGTSPQVFNHHLSYNFVHWAYVDIFIYFTHHRISVPPPMWINAAHKNGVKILGTFITEWEGGAADNLLLIGDQLKTLNSLELSAEDKTKGHDDSIWNRLPSCLVTGTPNDDEAVQNKEEEEEEAVMNFWVEAFVQIGRAHNLDGWFFNIESALPSKHCSRQMAKFIRMLTIRIHGDTEDAHQLNSCREGPIVIWYDSITDSGQLKWQNCLNEKNSLFFDSCDGIFSNYAWTPEHLGTSVAVSKNTCRSLSTEVPTPSSFLPAYDVYTGTDVFGRGTFGGGGNRCKQAVSTILQKGPTSAALFAPAWPFEANANQGRTSYEAADAELWYGKAIYGKVGLAFAVQASIEGDWTLLKNGGEGFSGRTSSDTARKEGESALVSSHQWSTRCCEFDLAGKLADAFAEQAGHNGDTEDALQLAHHILRLGPAISVTSWIKGSPPDCCDYYRLVVELRDAEHNGIAFFDSGVKTAEEVWKSVTYRFHSYLEIEEGSGASPASPRYLYWEDHAKDAEQWGGHYGTIIGQGEVVFDNLPRDLFAEPLQFPEIGESHCAKQICQVVPKHASCAQLPFYTNFNQGIGKHFWVCGQMQREEAWYDMSMQSIQPDWSQEVLAGSEDALRFKPSYDCVFDGGSSLELYGHFVLPMDTIDWEKAKLFSPKYFSALKLFRMEAPLFPPGRESPEAQVTITFKLGKESTRHSRIGVLLEIQGTREETALGYLALLSGKENRRTGFLLSTTKGTEPHQLRLQEEIPVKTRVQDKGPWKKATFILCKSSVGQVGNTLTGVHILGITGKGHQSTKAKKKYRDRACYPFQAYIGSLAIGNPEKLEQRVTMENVRAQTVRTAASIAHARVADVNLSWHVSTEGRQVDWFTCIEYFHVYCEKPEPKFLARCCSTQYTAKDMQWPEEEGAPLTFRIQGISKMGRKLSFALVDVQLDHQTGYKPPCQ